MAEQTKIEWTDATFNPWVGCTRVSLACDHCYAEGWAKRAGNPELWQGARRRTTSANWRGPIKWNAKAVSEGRRIRVFCASLADVFDNQAPTEWRDDLWALIRATPNLDWQLLTKRPQNISKMLPADWGNGYPNVWLGTTVENIVEQRRIDHLRAIPAAVRFLSCEPLMEAISPDLTGIHWVIVGGESGPGARPMYPDWARSLRDQCNSAGVPFFFKQWGEWRASFGLPPETRGKFAMMARDPTRWTHEHPVLVDHYPRQINAFGSVILHRVGKNRAGRKLDGREWSEFPMPNALKSAPGPIAPDRASEPGKPGGFKRGTGGDGGSLDWFELRMAVCNAAPDLDPPPVHWLASECGISYCRECAIIARGKKFELGPLLTQSDYYRRTDWEDAFFAGIDGYAYRQAGHSGNTEACDSCGITLDYWLTDYGIKSELEHWADAEMSGDWSEIAYNIDRLFECSDEDQDKVRALAERFLAAVSQEQTS